MARKIETVDAKRRQKKKETGKDVNQASAPYHPFGEMPSQYQAEQSELERVGRKKRRTAW